MVGVIDGSRSVGLFYRCVRVLLLLCSLCIYSFYGIFTISGGVLALIPTMRRSAALLLFFP